MSGHTKWSEIRPGPGPEVRREQMRSRILAGEHPTLKVTAEPDERSWFLHVIEPNLVTQAETTDEIELTARNLVGLALEVPEDGFDLDVEFIQEDPERWADMDR